MQLAMTAILMCVINTKAKGEYIWSETVDGGAEVCKFTIKPQTLRNSLGFGFYYKLEIQIKFTERFAKVHEPF